jgi:rRNA maturation endonuclease Nob1
MEKDYYAACVPCEEVHVTEDEWRFCPLCGRRLMPIESEEEAMAVASGWEQGDEY